MSITTPDMKKAYGQLHGEGKFTGASLAKHLDSIRELIRYHDARTLLDYGCGKGNLYAQPLFFDTRHEVLRPTLYDPYYEPLSERPKGSFDGVICTDVMEHVPEEDVIDVLRDIFGYARKFVYLAICIREAKKTLPDGRNCHVTVQSPAWWSEKIKQSGTGRYALHIETVYTED